MGGMNGVPAALESIPRPPPQPPDLKGSRTDFVVEMVREMSRLNDPQDMVQLFRRRALALYGASGSLSISRRGLDAPWFRITRSTSWTENINPWKEPHRLPLLSGGVLAELLYDNAARVVHDIKVSPNDPAYEYLHDACSLVAVPLYEDGQALNMVVRISREPWDWDDARLAHSVLETNLFGRATSHLLMADQLRNAFARLDHELKRVADIQRSLLPEKLPRIPGLDLAASYKTAARAGGDYYDVFELEGDRWGFLIADVSGHGTPAAVHMAILRTILHAQCHSCLTPAELLDRANTQLCGRFTRNGGTFVTAFYGIYHPADRSLVYSCAGHNPPLLVDPSRNVHELDDAQGIPLAIEPRIALPEARRVFLPGETLLLYTDGITEAMDSTGRMYGRQRLLSCVREDVPNAQHIIDCVQGKLLAFSERAQPQDDQTLVAIRIR